MSMMLRLRQQILTPSMSATEISKRQFHVKSAESVTLLETIGRSFLTGYGNAVGSRTSADARALLEQVPRRFRGFAYEGAAMGYAILDGLGLAGRGNVATFIAGPADRHVYMAYVGVGWALARLPRMRWRRAWAPDPLLGWLALDGYGFHQAYFHTRRYIEEQFQHRRFSWPPDSPQDGVGGYPDRAIDQGIGRALWFVDGTDVERIADRIASFPVHRHSDLWSGAGLAATYAGGVDEQELQAFWKLAGDHRPQVAQGSAFGADARVRAGLVTDHTELATSVFCGMPAREAAAVAGDARADLPADGAIPAYEVWRRRIGERFVSLGRC